MSSQPANQRASSQPVTGQQAILLQLKQHGRQTAQQLADHLKISSVGARKHLLKLREAGLVIDESCAEKAGRPAQYWSLTAAGHREFPDRHGDLTVQLLDAVEQLFGANGMDQLIHQREQANFCHYTQALAHAETLADKVAALTQLRNDEGYMAVWEKDAEAPGVYWLHENHCPICDAAAQCLNFCRSELVLFQSVLGDEVQVERVNHILSGARRCSYRIAESA